jgi:hypothetical protein
MATTSKKITAVTVRENKGRDMSPKWNDAETMTTDQFLRHFRNSMDWYRLESTGKELKPKVISWMSQNGYSKEDIAEFKATRDSRCNTTMGGIAANLLKGMPDVREDFNNGRSTVAWLKDAIKRTIDDGRNDVADAEELAEAKTPTAPVASIQARVRDAAFKMTEEIEDALEMFAEDPEAFDPKSFKVLNLLKGKDAKAAHARIIRDFYNRNLTELEEVPGTTDEDLKDAYSHLSKTQLKKITAFYQEIVSACGMLMQEAKVNKKPRVKKPTDKAKVVAKLKYAKSNEQMKLVSVNPVDIIGAQELWVYNTKSRKLGKYVAAEFSELSVKGTSIVNYNESLSVQKTLRKPLEQLNEFKSAGKVQLRKFLDDIKAVDIKLNGRINEEVILLKVQ